MSGFDLVPLAGGAPVRLPPGQTVLGRGPLLGTHLNPCFIQSPLADGSPRPLNKDCWYDLNHGDLFSLLPGQLVFRVAAVGDDTPRYKIFLILLMRVINPICLMLSCDSNSCFCFIQEDPPTEVEDDGRDITPSVTKKRVLPAWMMAAGPCSLKGDT
uniref:PNK FHA domain-containing protein n=1 Tax=Echeneis naucrates TaxID=173247 RepID=A0A665T4L9_ECHNA